MVFPVALTIGQTSMFSLEVIFWIGCHECMTYLRLNLLCRCSEFIFIKCCISLLDAAFSMLLGMRFLFSWLLNIFRWQIFPSSAISMNLYEYILIGFFWRYYLHTCLFFRFLWSQIVSCLTSWSIWATIGFEG